MAVKRSTRHTSITPRHMWLAALGVISLAQREMETAVSIARDETQRLRENATQAAVDARDILRGAAMTAQERIEPGVLRFSADVEARLAPVLRKFGVPVHADGASHKNRKARATAKRKKSTTAYRKPATARRTRAA